MDYQREHYPFTIDTVGIPNYVKEMVLSGRYYTKVAEGDIDHLSMMQTWKYYKMMGEEWGGLSVEEAYWEKKRRRFIYTGYRSVIQEIAQYAHETQDKLIIKHLKQFKKKHPDYPLEYF